VVAQARAEQVVALLAEPEALPVSAEVARVVVARVA
jgi:hypothetical protein